jgi:hypothetical protein
MVAEEHPEWCSVAERIQWKRALPVPVIHARMPNPISVLQQRGRPALGQDPVVSLRLPPDEQKLIDSGAGERDQPSRSDACKADN